MRRDTHVDVAAMGAEVISRALATMVLVVGAGPSVTLPTVATPLASVVCVAPSMTGPPATDVKVTVTPPIGFPDAWSTRTAIRVGSTASTVAV
ncbi:MAG TPA: hypothetical protein VGM82_11680 [Gemmatimonadaceae bacterium]